MRKIQLVEFKKGIIYLLAHVKINKKLKIIFDIFSKKILHFTSDIHKHSFIISNKIYDFNFFSDSTKKNQILGNYEFQSNFKEKKFNFTLFSIGVQRPCISPRNEFIVLHSNFSFGIFYFRNGEKFEKICEFSSFQKIRFDEIFFLKENLVVILLRKSFYRIVQEGYDTIKEEIWETFLLSVKLHFKNFNNKLN